MLDLQAIRSRAAASRADAANAANPANWLIEADPEACTEVANPANDPAGSPCVSQLAKLANVPERAAGPHALTLADGNRAHALPWGDREVTVFQEWTWKLQRQGFAEQDADDLAERLALRDLDADDRAACIECRRLVGSRGSGFRCTRPAVAGLHGRGEVGEAWVTLLQRCPAFSRATP